jgi:RNA polymerase sigma factor (sigma-70 family)
MNVNETELVRLCQQGNPRGQKLLYDRYADRLYRLAVRYVRNSAEAEDVVMQAFVKIFAHVGKLMYHEPRSFQSWMFKIVVNEALMMIRKRHNFHLVETLDEENPDHEKESLPETDAGYLYQMILDLPDGYRTVFNLYAVEGYDHREIASLLGISESTSRSQYFKAKQLLQRKIKQEGFHYGT